MRGANAPREVCMPLRLYGFVRGLACLALIAPAMACGATGPSPAEIPAGDWAADGARATVSAQGARLELDCAGAEITPPLTLDGQGRFSLGGWWERRAGPQPYRRFAARFTGSVRGSVMSLEITLQESAESVGRYELRLGGTGQAPGVCR